MLRSPYRKSFAVLVTLVALAAARTALAGPPLLCHPFDIGDATSLPWDGSASWQGARADYPLSRLVTDMQSLLSSSTPIVVRMETLRRAAIYAGRDPKVAARLFTALTARAESAGQAGRTAALAYLDAAYYVGAIRELSQLSQSPEVGDRGPALRAIVQGTDGYTLAAKALALQPGDAAMEFAAALIAIDGHRDAYTQHAQKARAGAAQDALLARNIRQVQ
jgi:hypothetical protein